jgi:hypothetical protein
MLETSAVEPSFASVELAVSKLAAAGMRRWRAEPVDVEALCEAPLVRERLLALGAGSENDVDAQRDAVEEGVMAAIKSLPHPYYTAAGKHFGLDDHDAKPLGKIDREQEAATALDGKSQRWYFEAGRSAKYLDKTPSQYVIALVACALYGIADPVSYLSRQATTTEAQSPDTPLEPTPPLRDRRRRVRLLVLLVAVVFFAAVVAAVSGFFNIHGRESPLPPIGSIIDASSGKASPKHTALASSASYGAIEGGNILRACDAAITQPCEDPAGEGIYAKPGDTLKFRLYLKNRFNGPIQLLKVRFTWEQQKSFATAAVDWTKAPSHHTAPDEAVDSIEISFTDHHGHQLIYIPGSSALYSISGEGPRARLARLPDGIMSSNGIQLADFGPPASCFDCIPAYDRIIEFSARAT